MSINQEAAAFSLYAYLSSTANRPALPPQWGIAKDRTEGTQGFAYAAFLNTSTHEVVIAFRGSDDGADWLTNAGLTIAQERQGAVIAAQYINEYGWGNVRFTGHSLGGGIAATMAVWFNRPATVFDPAPTQAVATDLAVVNSVIGLLGGGSAHQSIQDYSAALTVQFALRESNVTSYYAPGSAVQAISTAANTITGQGYALQFGASKMEVDAQLVNLHSQALLTAGMLAPNTFPQATLAVQWALPVIFDKSLYNLRTDQAARNFLIDLTNVIAGTIYNDTINLSGTEVVNIAFIDGGAGADAIVGSAGNDTIIGGAGADNLRGGAGADTFVYASVLDMGDTIADFAPGQDRLDIGALLNSVGYVGHDPVGDGYLRAMVTANTTGVWFDTDGVAGAGVPRLLVQLTGATSNAQLLLEPGFAG